jgi:hypothetical protein
MYCSSCGIEYQDNAKFCRRCGANLTVVPEAVHRGGAGRAELQSDLEVNEHLIRMLLKKIEETRPTAKGAWGELILPELMKELKELTMTVEERRQKYLRQGMISTGVGLGVSLFLYLFFGALTSTGLVPQKVAPILQAFWAGGLIPLFIGLMMMFYGLLFLRDARKAINVREEPGKATDETLQGRQAPFISVTEQTTTRLESPEIELPNRPVGGRSISEK